ncbi:MAG: extracellular solute-binding protein, partial [Candidatus Bathyarchaeia archaeon]
MGEKAVSRRGYAKYAATGIVAIAIGAAGGYFAAPQKVVEKVVTQTVTQAVTKTVTAAGPTPTTAPAKLTSEIAVEAAKKYSGTTLQMICESGFDEYEYGAFAKEFERLTGVKIEITPIGPFQWKDKIIAEGIAKSGALDIANVIPASMCDLIGEGGDEAWVIPLDDFINKYQADMSDFVYRDYYTYYLYTGKHWAMPIDADDFILYYRKDLFEHPEERANFKKEFGYDLAPPKTWKEYEDIAKFFQRKPGDKLAGKTIDFNFGGHIEFRATGGNSWWFFNRMASYGARYFIKTENDLIPGIDSPEAIQALEDMVRVTQYGIPEAAAASWTEVIGAYEQGNGCLNIFWPMLGKHAQFIEGSKLVDKLGYALMPAGPKGPRSQMAAGKVLCIPKDSRKQEPAYLFCQWLTSPEILYKVNTWTEPGTLGALDVIRRSGFENRDIAKLWPGAWEYLEAHRDNLKVGHPDLEIPGEAEYRDAIEPELTNAIMGKKSAE